MGLNKVEKEHLYTPKTGEFFTQCNNNQSRECKELSRLQVDVKIAFLETNGLRDDIIKQSAFEVLPTTVCLSCLDGVSTITSHPRDHTVVITLSVRPKNNLESPHTISVSVSTAHQTVLQ